MYKKILSVILMVAFLLGSTFAVQAASTGKDGVGPVEESPAVYSDISAPVSEMVGVSPYSPTDKTKSEKPLRILPNMGNALN